MKRLDSARLRRRPIVTLISDIAVNCNKGASFLERRAAVVTALVDAIEMAGFAVAVYASATCHKPDMSVACSVNVACKEPHDPADLARLAFGLGHSSMFRRFCFAAYGEDNHVSGLGHGLGTGRAFEGGADLSAQGAYVIPSGLATSFFASDNAAVSDGLAYLIDALASQGCPAFTGGLAMA
jgi:hypothetical protein